jgi:hypothetical protein
MFPHRRSVLCVISGFHREVWEIYALLGNTTVRCIISQQSAKLLDELFIYALTKTPTGKYNPTRRVRRERSERTNNNNRTEQVGENKSGLKAKTEPKSIQ